MVSGNWQPVMYERVATNQFIVDPFLVSDSSRVQRIFISEKYDPGWKCTTASGEDIEISSSGYCMYIQNAPESRLTFKYEPVGYRVGLWISLVGGGVFIGLLMFDFINRKKNKD